MNKKLPAIIIILIAALFSLTSQESSLSGYFDLPYPLDDLVDQTVALVGERVDGTYEGTIKVTPMKATRGDVDLGILWAEAASNRIVYKTTTLRVISPTSSELASEALESANIEREPVVPDFILGGTIFIDDDQFYVTVQIIDVETETILGGFENSYPVTDEIAGLLEIHQAATSPVASGADPFEPDDPSSPTPLDLDTMTESHSIAPGGDEDWYVFTSDAGESLAVNAFTMGSTDTYIEIYGPDSLTNLTTSNDDGEDSNARVFFIVEPGETYYVKVKGYDTSIQGGYTLVTETMPMEQDEDEPNNSRNSATGVQIGESHSAMFSPAGDKDWYVVNLPRNTRDDMIINFKTTGNLDTYIEMYDESGTLLEYDDDSGDDSNAQVTALIEGFSQLYFMVRPYDETIMGPYTITISTEVIESDEWEPNNSMEEATPLTVNSFPQLHKFIPAKDHDWFSLYITGGGEMTFESFGELDLYFVLYDRYGNKLAENDDDGENYNAKLTLYLQPGTYYLEAYQIEESSVFGGEYEISVTGDVGQSEPPASRPESRDTGKKGW